MPKPSLYMLTWSEEYQRYTLHTQGHPEQYFDSDNEQMWHDWLLEHTSFAFQGQHGHMSVVKEARSRGSGYWYAYRSVGQRMLKRYLGQSSRVTLSQLEEQARTLAKENTSPPQIQPKAVLELPEVVPYESHLHHIPLLQTRLSPPRPPTTLVGRERLLKELDAVLTHQWLLLSASAGSGKTTLLSTWAVQSSHAVGWLSLDEVDNDQTHFWMAMIAALRTCAPAIGDLPLAMLSTLQPPPLSIVLTTLINEILGCRREIILILDDYQVIEEQAIHEGMLFLLDHLPSNLHLFISSRVDPPFPLSRWRTRGQLVEIREMDVRFTQEEANTFLCQQMGLALSQTEVEVLEQRTEGWIAGLQLAALSLRTHKQPSAYVQHFTGGQRFVLEYVQEEIFQQQPCSVQRFLLQISVLSRMNAVLCEALTGEAASQEMLETLVRENLFVVPLDEERHWYRLHALFRDVLRLHLQATEPELVSSLHQRAAHWYAEQGFIHEAIAHALTTEDYIFAAVVMEQAAGQLWMNGEAKTIATWVLMLPEAVFQVHMGFALTSALHVLTRTHALPEQQRAQALSQSEQIMRRVEQTMQRSKDMLSQVETQRLQNRINYLRICMDMSEALRTGDLAKLRQSALLMQPLVVDEAVCWKWPPLHGLFVSAQFLGDVVLLLPELLAMKQQAFQEQDQATALVVMCWIAAAYVYKGKLRLLQQECLQVQDLLKQAGEHVAVAAYPAFDLSFLYYEWNQLEQAEASLQVAMQHATRWQDMTMLVWSSVIYVKVLLAAGKTEDAEKVLLQAQSLVQQSGLTMYAPDVMAAQVSLWLVQGQRSAFEAWAHQYVFTPEMQEYTRGEEYVALARVYLELQQYEQCLQLLAQVLSWVERYERQWDVIHLLALQVAALYGLKEMAQARQVAVRLLTLTEPEGYIRVYLDAGEPMRHVLQSFLDRSYHHETTLSPACISYVSKLLAAFEQEESRRVPVQGSSRSGTEKAAPSSVSSAHGVLYEPLSPQEQRVLRLLVAGRTYAEIAQELVVSSNTIKTQVSSIYRKLGVSRRAEASIAAQRLHLL